MKKIRGQRAQGRGSQIKDGEMQRTTEKKGNRRAKKRSMGKERIEEIRREENFTRNFRLYHNIVDAVNKSYYFYFVKSSMS